MTRDREILPLLVPREVMYDNRLTLQGSDRVIVSDLLSNLVNLCLSRVIQAEQKIIMTSKWC